jgi:hypothetical protein
MRSRSNFWRAAVAATLVAVGAISSAPAAETAAKAAPPPEDHSAEFKVLDIDIARLDALIERYDEPVSRVNNYQYRNLFKSRVEALKESFDQARYDELRYDINLQCQRIASWLAPLKTLPRSQGRPEFTVAKLRPSASNPAEVKAALAALDHEIKRLEDRAGQLVPGSPAREAEAARVRRIKERRVALEKNFTKAGWDAMVGDLSAP